MKPQPQTEPDVAIRDDGDPGPVPEPAQITWSTLVVAYNPDFSDSPLPLLESRPLRYDRQRSLVTEGGLNLLTQAAIIAAARPDQVFGLMLGVNWFVAVPDEGWIQYTADTPMIDIIASRVEKFGSYRVVRRKDHGTRQPPEYVR